MKKFFSASLKNTLYQLLILELPQTTFKSVLIIGDHPEKLATFLQSNKKKIFDLSGKNEDSLFAFLKQQTELGNYCDLIILDQVLEKNYCKNSQAWLNLYLQKILLENGLLLNISNADYQQKALSFWQLSDTLLEIQNNYYKVQLYSN